MGKFYKNTEYTQKRYNDEKTERSMRDVLKAVYYAEGLTPTYNTVKETGLSEKEIVELEKKGFDVKLHSQKHGNVIADEKAFTSKQNAYGFSPTFSFEVSTENNKDGNGWLFKEDVINTHYALVYPQVEHGEIQKTEILLIKRDVILEALKERDLDTREKIENYLNNNGNWNSDGRRRARIDDTMKIVHSAQLPESPVNIVIDRNWLRKKSDIIINNENVPKTVKEYKAMLNKEANEKSGVEGEKPQAEKTRVLKGIYLDNKAKDAFQNAGKNIQKLRSKTPPKFINWNFNERSTEELSDLIGKKVNIFINEYAVHNNSVILKGVVDKSISDKPVGIICGMADNNRNYENLSFKQLSRKQQFTLPGEIALMKDNEIVRKMGKVKEKEMEIA